MIDDNIRQAFLPTRQAGKNISTDLAKNEESFTDTQEAFGEAFATRHLHTARDIVAVILQRYKVDEYDSQFKSEIQSLEAQLAVLEKSLLDPRPGLESGELVKAFDALKKLGGLKICQPYREILDLLGEPIRFRLREIVLESMTKEKAMLAEELYRNPDDYVRRGVEGGAGGSVYGTIISATGIRNAINSRSDLDGVLGEKANDLSFGVGYGDPKIANIRFELVAKQEKVSGFGTINKFARTVSENTVEGVLTDKWPDIFPRFKRSVLDGIYGTMDRLDTLLGDNGRIRTQTSKTSLFEIPRVQMSTGFDFDLKGMGTSIRGLAFDNSTRIQTSSSFMKGVYKTNSKELVDSLLENNGYLYEPSIKKFFEGGIFAGIMNPFTGRNFTNAKDVDAVICVLTRNSSADGKDVQIPIESLRESLFATIRQQEQDVLSYCRLINEYDFAQSHKRGPAQFRSLRKSKHSMERSLGIKGRAAYLQKSTIVFCKLIKLYKDTYIDFPKKGLAESVAYNEIEMMKETFRAPPINLTSTQHIKAHRAQESTPISFRSMDLQGEFDISGLDSALSLPLPIPIAVRAHIKQRHRGQWHNPLSRGDFIELEAQLTGKLPP